MPKSDLLIAEVIYEHDLRPYPESRGVARDLVCLHCGQRDAFEVSGVCFVKLGGDGAVDDFEYEYHDDSYCKCPKCQYEGLISNFKVEGLDDALEAHEKDE